jgi:Fe-S oxidoreductase
MRHLALAGWAEGGRLRKALLAPALANGGRREAAAGAVWQRTACQRCLSKSTLGSPSPNTHEKMASKKFMLSPPRCVASRSRLRRYQKGSQYHRNSVAKSMEKLGPLL